MIRQFFIMLVSAAACLGQVNIVTSSPATESLTVTCGPGSELIGVFGVYSQTCHATGGTGVYSWAVSGLPTNFSSIEDTGASSMTIAGIPYHMATHTAIVTALDSSKPPLSGTAVITVVAQAGITGSSK